MKHLTVFLLYALSVVSLSAMPDMVNGKTKEIRIGHLQIPDAHMADLVPTAFYYESTQVLTIEFPVAGFEPYTLSVSSMYNTLDFYVTTPFVSVPINDTNVTIELQLETASGDMYYGSFEATSNTSTD